jgi:hypothetical protein
MRRGRGQGNIAASPVLIGATTVLIAIVAVFIAYNANSGLPFVPTYELNAELPSGGKLVKGNEVRVGGFRVGVVKELTPEVREVNGQRRSVAVAKLSLDKKLEPLARRPSRPATPSRSSRHPSRSSSRTSTRRSTATRALTFRTRRRDSATPSRAAGSRSTARSRRSTPSSGRSRR